MSREKVRPVAILTVISLAAFLAIVDGTVVALTLPAIGRDLGAGIVGLAWVPNAYVVTYTALLATARSLGDRLGRRPVFLAGPYVLALSAAGAMGCLPAEQAGVGAATFNPVRQIGSSIGVPLPAAALASVAGAGAVEIPASAAQGAFAAAFLARASAFALATVAVTVVLLWPRPPTEAALPLGAGSPLTARE